MNIRRPHYLSRNKASQRPTHLIFFDVETKGVKLDDVRTRQDLVLGWAMYWDRRGAGRAIEPEWFEFTTAEQFWDWVESHTYRKNQTYLIAHNIDFDAQVLDAFTNLTELGWELKSLYLSQATNIIRFQRDSAKIVLLDNLNWFHCSLKVLGESLGEYKLDADPLTVTGAELSAYCRQDVNILYVAQRTWIQFLDDYDLGNWAMTLPSQALKAFRHRFMNVDLLVHQNDPVTKLERSAYRGGRTSVFWKGVTTGQPFYKVDLNSAYPWAMKHFSSPTRLLFYTDRCSVELLRAWLADRCVVAEVTVQATENCFPVHWRGRNVYPLGKFTTALTTPELNYALARGWIVNVLRAAVYQAEYIFGPYVDHFYGLKSQFGAEHNEPMRYCSKLFLNSLYGKFGQQGATFIKFCEVTSELDTSMGLANAQTGEVIQLYRFGDWLWREEKGEETADSMPAISAHATAYVRMRLHELRLQAGLEHTYYCDTDSLIVDAIGLQALSPDLDNDQLGKLKIEATSDGLRIEAPKTYLFDEHWTRKGIPAKALQLDERTFQFTSFPSMRQLSREAELGPYVTKLATRRLQLVVYDGVVQQSGWVTPLTAENLLPDGYGDPESASRVWELEAEIHALEDSKVLPEQLIFRLWDYTRGTWKQQRNSRGALVPIEYSRLDSQATELGFRDLDDLLAAVQHHVAINQDLRILKHERQLLLHEVPKE